MTEIKAQKDLLEIVLEYQRLDQRLYVLAEQLPRPANQDVMLEGKIPSDVATEIFGTIEFIRSTELKAAIEGLEAAAKITGEDLERRFAEALVKDAALASPTKAGNRQALGRPPKPESD